MNIYVKTATADAENAMKTLETMCATTGNGRLRNWDRSANLAKELWLPS
jgi:hypothetical protein